MAEQATQEQTRFKPTLLEWKVEIAKAKIAHSLELYRAKIAMLVIMAGKGGK